MLSWLNQFLDLPRFHKRVIALVADTLLLTFALWAAFSLRLETWFFPSDPHYGFLFLGTLALSLGCFIKLGLYRAVIRFMSNQAIFAVVAGVTASTIGVMVMGFMLHLPIPRSVPVIYWAIALVFTGGTRLLVRSWVHVQGRKRRERVIIYGAGSTGMQLASALGQGEGFLPVAFVDDDPARQKSIVAGLPIHEPARVGELIDRLGASRVLLALDEASAVQRGLILRFLEPFAVAVQTVPSMTEIVSGKAGVSEIRDLDLDDLLGRDPVAPRQDLLDACIKGKVVMVTGAGGSIGSELCRQIVALGPRKLVLFDISEFGLYQVESELRSLVEAEEYPVELSPVIGSVQKEHRLEVIMRAFGVQTIYHAAAYKHVPMVEHNVVEGVRNNVYGTWYAAEAAVRAEVETFVLVSTDKAVRPTNVMGASKRLAELVLQGLARRESRTRFSMVRFGNVLGSSGSVVPRFRDQIRNGGPVTVTHPDIYRYFMTIPEAAQLVLQAGSMGTGGEVYVLNMGEPVRIADLARKMVHLMGFSVRSETNPEGEIEIRFTGLRPGEKLYEELLIGENPQGTEHPRIMKAREQYLEWPAVQQLLEQLDRACHTFACHRVRELLEQAPLGYEPSSELADLVWCQDGVVVPEESAETGESRKVARLHKLPG